MLNNLPVKRKSTPSGWISFNCPKCNDKRGRGGIKVTGARISFNCFNCEFVTGWSPDVFIGAKYFSLAESLGATGEEISQVRLLYLKYRDTLSAIDKNQKIKQSKINEIPLPESAINIEQLPDEHSVKKYAIDRGVYGLYPLYFFDESNQKDRLIIPFYYDDYTVGWVGRSINSTNKKIPKYITRLESNSGYIFNINKMHSSERKKIIVCEGVLDAIKVDGVALLTNSINEKQKETFKKISKDKEIILCPDRDKAGIKLIHQCLEMKWKVSFPPWDKSCKDADDASQKYGRLATVSSIIEHATDNELKIKVKTKLHYG